MSKPLERILQELERLRCKPKRTGKGWSARCPAHDDHRPSLSLNEGDNGRALVKCHAGCSTEAVLNALGLQMADLMPAGGNGRVRPVRPRGEVSCGKTYSTANEAIGALMQSFGDTKPSAQWTYHDANGRAVGVVARWDRPNGEKVIRPVSLCATGWRIGAMTKPRPLYNLCAILKAEPTEPVVVVEGEKTADAARQCNLLATTSAGGAKAAGKTDWGPLRGRRVLILPDNDAAGEAYAGDVARLAGAADVRILRLADYATGLPTGGDLADVVASPDWCGLPLGEGAEPEDVGRWILDTAKTIEPWKPEPSDGDAPLVWKPYPADALPGIFQEFVETAAAALLCDPAMIALPLVVAAAAAIGTTRRLLAKPGWEVPSILWGAIVGDSGTLKTPAMTAARQWTERRQAELLKAYNEERKQHANAMLIYEKTLAAWKRSNDCKLPPAKPEAPAATRVLVQDTTVEALAPILNANPRGVLLARDELAGWLGGFDRYAQTQGGDVAHWLSLYNGQGVLVDRKTSGTIHVPTAAVSIMGGIQPGVLRRALGTANRENGLTARLLLVMPPRHVKCWTEISINPAIVNSMGDVFERLFALEHDTTSDGEPTPRLMRLDADAKASYVEFYNAHARELAAAEGDWAAALSKLEELPLRLALVLHLVRWAAGEPVNPDVVDADSMARAIRLTGWHKHETRRVYDALEAAPTDDEQRRLVEWISRQGGAVTVRDVTHGVWRFRGNPEAAEAALSGLVAASLGVWEDVQSNQKGGRPKRVFRLSHQHHHITKTSQNPGNPKVLVMW